jgi:hypothetical protein
MLDGPMPRLRACPFCRALYGPNDGRRCPDCDVELVPMNELPLSHEARELEEERVHPDDVRFRWNDFAHGRGGLLLLSGLGLGTFFCPWVEVSRPEDVVLSGFDLARRATWLWGGATGFFVLLPLLWTRRTLSRLRGARVIATLFSALTWLEVLVLLAFPPRRGLVPLEFGWTWGLYASAAVSFAATLIALRLGGSAPAAPPRKSVATIEPAPPPPNDRVLH